MTHETALTPESLAQVFRVCSFNDIAVYGEELVAHNVLSGIRLALWKMIKAFIKAYLMIERRTGFEIWKRQVILEPRIFVVRSKPYG